MGPGFFMEGGRLLVKILFVACSYRKHVSSHRLAPIPFLAPPIRVPSSYTEITAERGSINRTLRLQETDGGDDRTRTAARSVRLCASYAEPAEALEVVENVPAPFDNAGCISLRGSRVGMAPWHRRMLV